MSSSVDKVELQDFSKEVTRQEQEIGSLGDKPVRKISLKDADTLQTAIAAHDASAKQASGSYLKLRVVAGISAVVLTTISTLINVFFPPSLSMTIPSWIIAGIGATSGLSALPFGFSALTGWAPIRSMKEHKETAQKETQIVDDLKKVEKDFNTVAFKTFVKEEEIDETTLIDLHKQFEKNKKDELEQNNNILKTIQ